MAVVELLHMDVIALIELRLQPCDAKIPFSISHGWIGSNEKFQRQTTSRMNYNLQFIRQ